MQPERWLLSFPSTPILDDFNRANEGPPPSASWTGPATGFGNNLQVVSNAVAAVGAAGSGYWNPSTLGPDSEVYATYAALGTFTVLGRVSSPGATFNGYGFQAPGASVRMFRFDSGVGTQLGESIGQARSVGDILGLELVGSTLAGYVRTSGVWSAPITQTDSTYTSAGYLALSLGGTTGSYDDFGGGTIVVPLTRFTNTLGIRSPIRYDL